MAAAAVGSAGTLALAIAFVLININAMRVGLLSRFMGIIGAIIGGLYVLPILSGPADRAAVLAGGASACCSSATGREAAAPRGRRARPMPWPSAAELRAETAMDEVEPPAGERRGAGRDARPRQKRKRKKRR